MNYIKDTDEIKKTYQFLHTIPELAFEEFETHDFIINFLKNLDLKPITCAKTGVYADISGDKNSEKAILIRADIDALPIMEDSSVSFKSKNIGKMHACGHDMHTTTLLYVAKYLCENTDKFSGTVRVLFQPGEEGVGGAEPMIKEGALDKITAAIAMHVDPLEDSCTLLYKNGGITASPDDYKLIVKGKGGHAAEPEKCTNPLTIIAEIINEYSNIKTKYFKDKNFVTTVCTCESGSFNNIIPDTAEITGTVRTFDCDTRSMLKAKLEDIAKCITEKYNGAYEFIYNELYPPTINSQDINNILVNAAKKTSGIKNITELSKGSMTGDDFAYFAEKVPSSYFRFGVGGDGERYPLHSSKFIINHDSIPVACDLIINTVLEYLTKK